MKTDTTRKENVASKKTKWKQEKWYNSKYPRNPANRLKEFKQN
jgi:hypothetical protein